jgi:lysophospholipase L1-like esterase
MPMPAGIATVTVKGRYLHPDGTPMSGAVTFAAPSVLTFSQADTIAAGSVSVRLDDTGSFTATVLATDNANMQPTGWAYQVTEQMSGMSRNYWIALPSTTPTVDLADIAPADPASGNYVLVPGPAGPAGTNGNTILSGHGAPPNGTGVNGDYWMDQDAWELYGPKTSGAWPGAGIPLTGEGGIIQTVNGQAGPAVVLDAQDVGAVAVSTVTAKGDLLAASGAGALTRVGVGTDGQVLTADAASAAGVKWTTPSSGSSSSSEGVYVPAGWGKFWTAKRDAAGAGSALARIVTVGGSATQGFYASNPLTTSWPGLVRTALQAQYGDGGSGFFPTSLSTTVLSSGDATALAAWQAQGAIVGQTGTWSLSANRYGPGITGVYTEQTGATMTFTVRGTTVKIYNISGGTRPSFTYSIDGGAAQTVTVPAGSAAVQVTTITGLAPGTHTVVLTCGTTTTGQYLTVAGVAGENTSGVIVDNLARAGAQSSSYATLPESALNATWNGGVSYPCDLAIYTAGPNDASNDVAPDVWLDNVAAWLRGVRDLGTAQGNTDLVIGLPHLGRHVTSNYRYSEYASRLRGLAATYGAAVVDWWEIGRNSWPYWNTLGYWGTNAGTGAAGTDSVHLSDAGFAAMAAPVISLLES